ncbi:MAG: hypothetical protein Kow0029_00020 [Candidatus Rifleibacteriota bacterium]
MKKNIILILAAVVCSGCGSEPSPKPAAPTAKPESKMTKTEQLHQKAKVAEAASLVGYDGKDIRKKLDTIIDENARQQKMLEDLKDY